ncbi:NAD(P)-binding domain-containing protein [Dactylosporangium darangshiense]|uniref:NAD(P)-binding domain-containing protein n=1 Tax=Dactylosporangium darangshiense TaxID=579108 RepID=UPI003635D720
MLGVGRMGRAIAGRLLAGGHRVTVWNRSPGKAGEVVADGGREARDIGDAVGGADVAITMLADDAAVRAVALGELRSAIGGDTVYVDSSTVSPECSGRVRLDPAIRLPVPCPDREAGDQPDAASARMKMSLSHGDGV